MAQPTPYDRQFSFQDFQAQEPTTPLPGDEVDSELNAVKLTIDQTLVNLAKIQRDDGALKNGIVTQDALSDSLSIGFTLRGEWQSGVNYYLGDGVTVGSKFFRATASALSTAGNAPEQPDAPWVIVANFTAATEDAEAARDAAAASAAAADESAAQAAAAAQEAAEDAAAAVMPAIVDVVTDPPGLTADIETKASYDPDNGDHGFFSAYDCKGASRWFLEQAEDQASVAGGGFRDNVFSQHIDRDTTDYTAIGQKVSMAVRGIVIGKYNSDTEEFETQYKDLVGADFHAIGRIGWNARGVSGVVAGAIQRGTGIASNEFAVENPADSDRSSSMAGVQSIVRAYNGADDSTHVYRAVLASNQGHRITAGLQLQSAPASGSYTGSFRYGVDFTQAILDESALRLRGTGAGATVIEYDAGDYCLYDRANDRFTFVIGEDNALFVNATGLNFVDNPNNPVFEFDGNDYLVYDKINNRLNQIINGAIVTSQSSAGLAVGAGAVGQTSAILSLDQSTSGKAHIRLIPGATRTSPLTGEIWIDNTGLHYVNAAGVTIDL